MELSRQELEHLQRELHGAAKLLQGKQYAAANKSLVEVLQKLGAGRQSDDKENERDCFLPRASDTALIAKLVVSALYNRILALSGMAMLSDVNHMLKLVDCAVAWANHLEEKDPKSKMASYISPIGQQLLSAASRLDVDKTDKNAVEKCIKLRVKGLELADTGNKFFDHCYRVILLAEKADEPLRSVLEICDTLNLLDKASLSRVKAHPSIPHDYFYLLGVVCRRLEKSHQYDKASEVARHAQTACLVCEKKSNLSAEETLQLKAHTALTYYHTAIANAKKMLHPDCSDAIKVCATYTSHATKILSELLDNINVTDCVDAKGPNKLYEILSHINKALYELRTIYRQNLSPVMSKSTINSTAASNKTLSKQLEEFFLCYARLIKLGVDSDDHIQKQGTFSTCRHYLWECYYFAAQIAVERTDTVTPDALANINKAIELCKQSNTTEPQGIAFISSALYNCCVFLYDKAKAGESGLFKEVVLLLEKSCDLYERLGELGYPEYDENKLSYRRNLLVVCRQKNNDSKGALAETEEALKKAKPTDEKTWRLFVSQFVSIKLMSKDESIQSRMAWKAVVNSKWPIEQVAEVAWEEFRCYERSRAFTAQLELMKSFLDEFCPATRRETLSIRASSLLDLVSAQRQAGECNDSTSELVNEALTLLTTKANPDLPHFYDDLATAKALAVLVSLDSHKSSTFVREDVDKVKQKEKSIDPNAIAPEDRNKNGGDELEIKNNSDKGHMDLTDASKPLGFALRIWTQLLNTLSQPTNESILAANRQRFRSPRRTLGLLHSIASLAALIGPPNQRIAALKLMIKLHRLVIADNDSDQECIILYATLGEYLNELGYAEPVASRYFDKAHQLMEQVSDRLSEPKRTEWLLAMARFLHDSGRLDAETLAQLESIESELLSLTSTEGCRTATNYDLLARVKALLSRIHIDNGAVDEAVAQSHESLHLRSALLPREGRPTAPAGAVIRWTAAKLYADILDQTGQLYQLQGTPNMASYYYRKGLELATSLNIRRLRARFLLRLAHLQLKRRQWEDTEAQMQELTRLVEHFHGCTDEEKDILVAELKARNGDIALERTQQFDAARECYTEAEEYIDELTDSAFIQALDEALVRGRDTPTGAKLAVKLLKGSQSGPRLSLEPLLTTRERSSEESVECLPLQRLKLKMNVKLAVTTLQQARAERSKTHLERAISELTQCLIATEELIDHYEQKTAKEGGRPPRMLDNDHAFILYQLARALMTRYELEATDSADCYDILWRQNAIDLSGNVTVARGRGRNKSAKNATTPLYCKDIQEAKKLLDKALSLSLRGGSLPRLTADICTSLALITGSTNKVEIASLVNYSLGITMRHQVLSAVFRKLMKFNHTLTSSEESNSSELEGSSDAIDQLSKRMADLKLSSANSNDDDLPSTEEDVAMEEADDVENDDCDNEKQEPMTEEDGIIAQLQHLRSIFAFDESSHVISSDYINSFLDLLGELAESSATARQLAKAAFCSVTVTPNTSHMIIIRLQYKRQPAVVRIPMERNSTSQTKSDDNQAEEAEASVTVEKPSTSAKRSTSAREKRSTSTSSRSAKRSTGSTRSSSRAEKTEPTSENTTEQSSKPSANNALISLRDELNAVLDEAKRIYQQAQASAESKRDAAELNRQRQRCEANLQELVQRLDENVLGPWKFLLLGSFLDDHVSERADEIVDAMKPLLEETAGVSIDRDLLYYIFCAMQHLSEEEVSQALVSLFNWPQVLTDAQRWSLKLCIEQLTQKFDSLMEEFDGKRVLDGQIISRAKNGKIKATETQLLRRAPTILMLDKQVHMFPWESTPTLFNYPVSRMPSLAFIRARLVREIKNASTETILSDGIDTRRTFYIINPDGDLVNAEKMLAPLCEKMKDWTGLIRIPPNESIIADAFKNYDILLYCGHGGGEQYVHRGEIQNLIGTRLGGPVTILVGCSSAHTQEEPVESSFDATGPSMSYILAGVPALVGNLWTVTSVDADNETAELIDWISNPQRTESLLEALPSVRRAARMRYLNGAALICYGLPVFKR